MSFQGARKVQHGVDEKGERIYDDYDIGGSSDLDDLDDEDVQAFLNDPAIEAYQKARMEEIKARNEMEEFLKEQGTGQYIEADEMDFLEKASKKRYCVAHFYKKDFKRCQILHNHLEVLAKFHYETLFVKVNVEKSPFVCDKMKIRVLPTLLILNRGEVVKRYVGFTEFGNVDTFTTRQLEAALIRDRGLEPKKVQPVVRRGGDGDDDGYY